MKKVLLLIILNILLSMPIYAEHNLFIALDHLQNKEEFNHGIIFNGLEYGLGYGYSKNFGTNELKYEGSMKFGALRGKDILGINIALSPINISYINRINETGKARLFIGADFNSFYSLSFYPDLQMGDDFWISYFSISPLVGVEYQMKNEKLILKVSNSLLSMSSRPDVEKDEYYFSLRAKDIISDLHSNIKFNLPNNLNIFKLEADYVFSVLKTRLAVAYYFHYLDYSDHPKLREMNHGLKIKYFLGVCNE